MSRHIVGAFCPSEIVVTVTCGQKHHHSWWGTVTPVIGTLANPGGVSYCKVTYSIWAGTDGTPTCTSMCYHRWSPGCTCNLKSSWEIFHLAGTLSIFSLFAPGGAASEKLVRLLLMSSLPSACNNQAFEPFNSVSVGTDYPWHQGHPGYLIRWTSDDLSWLAGHKLVVRVVFRLVSTQVLEECDCMQEGRLFLTLISDFFFFSALPDFLTLISEGAVRADDLLELELSPPRVRQHSHARSAVSRETSACYKKPTTVRQQCPRHNVQPEKRMLPKIPKAAHGRAGTRWTFKPGDRLSLTDAVSERPSLVITLCDGHPWILSDVSDASGEAGSQQGC